jgi:pimeloyl-ACP methyl ester carboxylesterase
MKITRRYADLSSARLSWLEAGAGPVAILVHGFPLDARMWHDQLDALADDERRVVAVDLRGHGHSPWAGDAIHSMDRMAADLLALADDLDAAAFDLVGFSMGGYVALALAQVAPERIRTLALIDTKSGPDTEDGKAGRVALATDAVRQGRAWLHDKLSGALLGEDASDLARGRFRTIVESQPYESVVADLAGMRDRPDRTDVLAALHMPSAVIVGSDDAITPPADSEGMAGLLPAAELTVIENAGHMTPLEEPDSVSRALAVLWKRR